MSISSHFRWQIPSFYCPLIDPCVSLLPFPEIYRTPVLPTVSWLTCIYKEMNILISGRPYVHTHSHIGICIPITIHTHPHTHTRTHTHAHTHRAKAVYHHHQFAHLVRIFLTISRQSSLPSIAPGRSSCLHPVSPRSCCRCDLLDRPTLARPCKEVNLPGKFTLATRFFYFKDTTKLYIKTCRGDYRFKNSKEKMNHFRNDL